MHIVVVVKQIPDLVEEVELTADETDIDREYLSFVLNEFDDKALEQALLLKEAYGGDVTVVGFAEDQEIDQTLYTAIAKGADKGVKLAGAEPTTTHARASVVAQWLGSQQVDLVLTGVQAVDDLDGQLPALLGSMLSLPHVSVVIGVDAKDGLAQVSQEFSGGLAAKLEVRLPAVLGIQAAPQPPRYAPISRIRQAQQAGGLEEVNVDTPASEAGIRVRKMFKPVATSHAEMLEGSVEDVAERILGLLRERGLVRG